MKNNKIKVFYKLLKQIVKEQCQKNQNKEDISFPSS